MAANQHYLHLSPDNVFYTRLRVPKAISCYYDKKNIKVSLRTRSKKEAKTRCYVFAGALLTKFQTLEDIILEVVCILNLSLHIRRDKFNIQTTL